MIVWEFMRARCNNLVPLLVLLYLPTSQSLAQGSHWVVPLNLNGEWTFSIHGHLLKTITVPSTYLPVGGASLERHFILDAPLSGKRALLKFAGIVMTAEVFVNGTRLGRYGPYTPFSIDVTSHVKVGENLFVLISRTLAGLKPGDASGSLPFLAMAGLFAMWLWRSDRRSTSITRAWTIRSPKTTRELSAL